MTIQDQIEQDVATVTENAGLRSQLFDFLQSLKTTLPQQSNREKNLSHAGVVQDDEAQEMLKIVREEFGKVDGEWH